MMWHGRQHRQLRPDRPNRGESSRRVAALVSTLAALAGGCAAPLVAGRAGASGQRASDDARSGWAAALDGRDGDAASAFRRALERDPNDLWARFGDASLAFERGDVARALESYLALLEGAATRDNDGPATAAVAAMATGRLAVLLEEFGGPEDARRATEDRLFAVPLSRLPWEARYGLAIIWDRAARRRGDTALLARASRAAGCVRGFTVAPAAGALPHLDLDATARAAAGSLTSEALRTVEVVGCVAAAPAFDGRAGAQRLLVNLDVPGDASYDIVLDFRGEARVIVDGGAARRHGGATEYGPRVSASRVSLSRGRHQLEIRLATFGGHPDLVVLVAPAHGSEEQDAPAARAVSHGDPLDWAADFATTYVANRRGQLGSAWAGAARLEQAPRFALGLALAASVARDDPSRPANFTRDHARSLYQTVVTIDPSLARARHALASIALDDDRPREAVEEAQAATKAAPGWWLPEWTLYAAYRLRGLTWDADLSLDRAIAHGFGACPLVQTALGRAEDRHDVDGQKRFGAALVVCGRASDERIDFLRRLGDLRGAEAAARVAAALAPERDDAKLNLAAVLLARGRPADAAELIAATVDRRDAEGQLRLADAWIAAGRPERARATIGAALAAHPEIPELLRAARALGLPLPLDPFRLDGVEVIRAFEASKRRYDAPAVVVLDRTVTRIFPGGAEMVLNHEIVRVQSKDAIQKWGEISVPEGNEILVLRTHKADGSTREPEDLAGKDTISAADLALGDYVEKETIETRSPRDAFLTASGRRDGAGDLDGGFLGDRFYFQSFDAPLDRSEYLIVTTPQTAAKLHFDRRAGAPEPTRSPAPPVADGQVVSAATDGNSSAALTVTTFAATGVPQLFAERSSVPSIEYVPSVRISTGLAWTAWTRFLREQLYGTLRAAPVLEQAAAEIRALSPDGQPRARAAALVAWVGHNVEADDDLRDSASLSVARGRGNRLAATLALARVLGLDARPVLARSRLTAEGQAPPQLEEADDFADPLVRFELPGKRVVYADPRLKHAPLGYLPPGLDGACVLDLDRGSFEIAHSAGEEHRAVDASFHLDDQGGGKVEVVETVRGWPALEWAEIVDRFGADPTKLRQDFEQRWLGVHFPGAVLQDLQIDVQGSGPGSRASGRDATIVDRAAAIPAVTASSTAGAGATPTPAQHEQTSTRSPRGPYAAAEVRLRYSFSSGRLALKRDREIRFLPTFFRSQPGRRYATEPRRLTALMTGFDVPLDLRARVDLPPGARLLATPRAPVPQPSQPSQPSSRTASIASQPTAPSGTVVGGTAGYRFFEARELDLRAQASAPVLVIRRQSVLPIMRVPLRDYPEISTALRRVDALEQEEIRIGLGPERP